jgi:hypothetical protein
MWVLVLLACEEAPAAAGGAPQLADYVGVVGFSVTLAPAEDPTAEPLQLRVSEGTWEARLGEEWDDGVLVGSWVVETAPSLTVDGTVLIAPPLDPPEPYEVRYGTFPEVVTRRVKDGAFAGEWAFAHGLGPIVATVDGERRECIVYDVEPTEEGA